jgi:hypothetical protein
MKKSVDYSVRESRVSNIPVFGHTPPPRCCKPVEISPRRLCGTIARFRREQPYFFHDAYYCETHRLAGDISIDGEFKLRRVRITCDIFFAGVDVTAAGSQAEAVAALDAAVTAVGGMLDISRVRSSIGRYEDYAGSGEGRPAVGKG